LTIGIMERKKRIRANLLLGERNGSEAPKEKKDRTQENRPFMLKGTAIYSEDEGKGEEGGGGA